MTIDSTTDFVAATARSGPAPTGSVNSQARATGDVTSFTMAIVSAPLFLADRAPVTRSGLRPDCDMTMKTAFRISIDCLYVVTTEGADVETGKPAPSFKQIAKKSSCISGTATA